MAVVPAVTIILAYAVGGIGIIVASLGYLNSGGGGGGMTPSFNASELIVDADHLQEQIDRLSLLSNTEPPAVTRILFTQADLDARKFVKAAMEDAGLVVREDAIGNMFGRWVGRQPSLGAVLTGSHTDAIPHAGKFDGVLGVLGGIEAVRALKQSGFLPLRSIDVLMFTSEEPTRFGYGCLGSRMMANQGGYPALLAAATDSEGISFASAARSAGYGKAMEKLDDVVLNRGQVAAFVELHIEQGPFLEAAGLPIGVVTAIAAPAALIVEFEGNGGHAGGTLMPYRNDSGLAAAELALAVESAVLATGSDDTVGTSGKVELHPGAINSIPSLAHLEIDVRDIDEKRRDSVVAAIKAAALDIARRRGVKVTKMLTINADPPATCHPKVVQAIATSAAELGLGSMKMVSRAYHDALFMSRIAPTGMIFIPCYKGYSHRPDEYSSKEDMARGVAVLALTLAKLSAA